MERLPGSRCYPVACRLDEGRSADFLAPESSLQSVSLMALAGFAIRFVPATLLGLALAASTVSAQAPAPSQGQGRPDILFVQASQVRASELSARFPDGSRVVRLMKGEQSPVNLTPEFFAAADPEISFDGARVLFAAREVPSASWQIWEMRTDGSSKRQITQCPGDCLRPAYLPREEIVFTALSGEAAGADSQLWVANRDGTEAHRITFGPGDFQLETVLQNGLILASARSPLLPKNGTEASRELYTVRVDGSGLASFRCDHPQHTIRGDAEELEDGSVVFVRRQSTSQVVGGELATIRRGALHNSLLAPLPARIWSPKLLEEGKLIVARRADEPAEPETKLDLYAFDSTRGRFEGLIYRDPKLSSLAAVAVAAHPTPRAYWSTLNPAGKVGYFVCLDSALASEASKGRLSASLSKLRVLTLNPLTHHEEALGEAPIETDGSFYIAIPADRPVRFEVLDAEGHVVRAQRSWLWARPGEEHGCVGCHEDRAVAPENRWPLALRRFDTPTRLGVPAAEAAPQPAH
jgi:hypothetical protein